VSPRDEGQADHEQADRDALLDAGELAAWRAHLQARGLMCVADLDARVVHLLRAVGLLEHHHTGPRTSSEPWARDQPRPLQPWALRVPVQVARVLVQRMRMPPMPAQAHLGTIAQDAELVLAWTAVLDSVRAQPGRARDGTAELDAVQDLLRARFAAQGAP